ncbi:MAG: BatD family protein [Opitutaceae bacterium]|nr:BatD family protein [Opitutaceae bacterium]
MRRANNTAFVLLCLWSFGRLEAQTAQWQPNHGSLGVGQASEIQLVFEDCAPTSNPQPPKVPGLSLELTGTSQSIQTFNASISRRINYTFLARPTQRGPVRIPAFDVATDKGQVRAGAADFDVGDATVGQAGTSLDAIVQSRIHLPSQSVWAGEVFPLQYTLTIARRYSPQLASAIEWTPAPLTVEEWGKLETSEMMVGGEARLQVTNRSRGLARSAGTIIIKPAQQLVNLQTGTSMFGVFSRPTMEQYSISSPPGTLNVKPLPSPAPPGFNGAVGKFDLASKVVPSAAAVGEPITWTLELSGTGNWPDIAELPARQVSRDFRIVQPQPKRTVKEGSLFDASFSEDIVLIPTKAGTYPIGPYQWSYFDPKAGEYKTVMIAKAFVTVSAPPTPVTLQSAGALPPGAVERGASRSGSIASTLEPAPPPKPVPGDPIIGSHIVPAPKSTGSVATWSLLSLPALALLWFALALRRARLTDSHRRQRDARMRLGLTLKALAAATETPVTHTLLREWQHDTLVLLGLSRTYASASHLVHSPLINDKSALAAWIDLWAEADRVLYSIRQNLPEGWIERAQGAMASASLPRFSLLSLFAPRNLLPFVASFCVLMILPPVRGANALELYREGKFAEAQKSWSDQVARDPTDWVARHNLSLALEQQDRWGEAAAHATAAYLQQPANEEVRKNWSFALNHAGYLPSQINNFVSPGPLHQVAQEFSPSVWKLLLIVWAWSAAGAAGVLLLRAFSFLGAWAHPAAYVVGCISVLLAGASYASIHAFGLTADSRSVIFWRSANLRSVPTFADTTQKTTPVAPGTVAVVDKTFLKWHRLRFPDGQTGWIPAAEVIPLWRSDRQGG